MRQQSKGLTKWGLVLVMNCHVPTWKRAKLRLSLSGPHTLACRPLDFPPCILTSFSIFQSGVGEYEIHPTRGLSAVRRVLHRLHSVRRAKLMLRQLEQHQSGGYLLSSELETGACRVLGSIELGGRPANRRSDLSLLRRRRER